jgi:hypothetical protein
MASRDHSHPAERRTPRRGSQRAGREPRRLGFSDRERRGGRAGLGRRRHPPSCRSRRAVRRASPQPPREGSISVACGAPKRQKLTPHAARAEEKRRWRRWTPSRSSASPRA